MNDATILLLFACRRTCPVLNPARECVHIELCFRSLELYLLYCLIDVTRAWVPPFALNPKSE